MPRKRSTSGKKPAKINDQSISGDGRDTTISNHLIYETSANDGIGPIKSLLDEDSPRKTAASTSSSPNTAALHDELDLFRQRWRRELEIKAPDTDVESKLTTNDGRKKNHESIVKPSSAHNDSSNKSQQSTLRLSYTTLNDPPHDPQEIYDLAKKLFLIGVSLEQDELHNESIRYYKQAIHLYPNIERQIFREQTENHQAATNQKENVGVESCSNGEEGEEDEEANKMPILERIRTNHLEDSKEHGYTFCKPAHKVKQNSLHLSQLPRDLILKICQNVIGQELDLVSLEQFGMVCRGFYLISNEPTLWKSICYRTWGVDSFTEELKASGQIDWRQVYIYKPRVNCDGVYISKTRYIRQGEVGFQDITYRPFHLIRYYRYMRFFSNKRVLILTTNEEPERIKPIFRHAVNSKHFSPELSVIEGSYEFVEPNQVLILAEREFQNDSRVQQSNHRNMEPRRQAQFHWSRQTPLNQKFTMKFELRTNENRPFRNNTLKWTEYAISTKFETGTEVTDFDLSPDTFPNLVFTRI